MSSDAPTGVSHSPRAVVAGHGDFAAGIISAVEQISGAGNVFRGVSNASLDAAALDAVLRDAVDAVHADVVFTDLPAGSCTIAARRLTRDRPALAVVTGTNLPMLLDYALKPVGGRIGAERSAAKGREAIAVAPAAGAPEGDRAH